MSALLSLKPDAGISLDTFSQQTGIRKGQLLYYCRKGRIAGAIFNRTLWQWRIYALRSCLWGVWYETTSTT